MDLFVNAHGLGSLRKLARMEITNITQSTRKADINHADYEYAVYDFTQKACYQGEVKNFNRELGAIELLKRCLKNVPVKIGKKAIK